MSTLLALALLLALLAPAGAPATSPVPRPVPGAGPETVERGIVRRINRERARRRLAPLQTVRPLVRSARAHSRDMARESFFGHDSGDGAPWFTRVRRFMRAHVLGETIAMIPSGLASDRAGAVVDAWMRSPAHRAELVRPAYRRIGVAHSSVRVAGLLPTTVLTANFASAR